MQCSRKAGPLIVRRHIRQNEVVIFLKILVAAKLLGHSAGIAADRIGLVVQFRRRAAETERDLPDNQLSGAVAGVGIFRRLQIGTIWIAIGESKRQQVLLFR